jgi:hypothetical protein
VEFEKKEFAQKALNKKRHSLKQSVIISTPYRSKYDESNEKIDSTNASKKNTHFSNNQKFRKFEHEKVRKFSNFGSKATKGSIRNITLAPPQQKPLRKKSQISALAAGQYSPISQEKLHLSDQNSQKNEVRNSQL